MGSLCHHTRPTRDILDEAAACCRRANRSLRAGHLAPVCTVLSHRVGWCMICATECVDQTDRASAAAVGPSPGSAECGAALVRQVPASNRPAVLPDGSYASQTALADTFAGAAALGAPAAPNLRTFLLAGDFFLGGVVAGAPGPKP